MCESLSSRGGVAVRLAAPSSILFCQGEVRVDCDGSETVAPPPTNCPLPIERGFTPQSPQSPQHIVRERHEARCGTIPAAPFKL